MTPLLGIIFLFILAYIGSFLYERYHLATGWTKVLLYSGSLNLVIGYIIGPHFFGLLSDEIIGKLYVLVALVLGWAGFLIGLQAKASELKRFQSTYYLYSGLNFLLTFFGLFFNDGVVSGDSFGDVSAIAIRLASGSAGKIRHGDDQQSLLTGKFFHHAVH